MAVTLFTKGLAAIRGFLAGGTAKSSVVDDDYLLISDSADTDALKRLKFQTLKDQVLGDADALVYQGTINCSANPDYPAADAGHVYKVSHAGKIGGASGETVEVGDFAICNTDATATGDQATVGDNWDVFQSNLVWETAASNVKMNGTQALGSSGLVANSDHVHPSDTTKVSHSLATAENDFLVGAPTPFGSWIKKTLAETKTILSWVLTSTAEAVGFTISGGTTSKTLTVDEDVTISNKADKAPPATAKNLAGLVATTGQLEDSGITPAIGASQFTLAGGTGTPRTLTVDATKSASDIHAQNTDTKLDEGGANEVTAAEVKSAVSASHTRSHSITSTDDHTSTATAGQMLKADANGLPVDATNTDAEVSGAVSASHTQGTDTGTTSTTFQIDSGNSGPQWKNDSGTLAARNADDADDAPISAETFKTDSYTFTVDETKSLSDKANMAAFQRGTDTFNSTTGVSVSLSPAASGTDYHISVTPLAESDYIGQISVESRTVNSFTVKNSGSDDETNFAWQIIEV
jgi:hypothetical protein